MTKRYFFLDLDGPVCDYYGRMCDIFGYSEYHPYSLELKWPEFAECVKTLTKHPPFYLTLPIMPGAKNAILGLKLRYDVIGITARPDTPGMRDATRDNLEYNGITLDNLIFAQDKEPYLLEYEPDFFLDDNPKHLNTGSLNTIKLMWAMDYNRNETSYITVHSWDAVLSEVSMGEKWHEWNRRAKHYAR